MIEVKKIAKIILRGALKVVVMVQVWRESNFNFGVFFLENKFISLSSVFSSSLVEFVQLILCQLETLRC